MDSEKDHEGSCPLKWLTLLSGTRVRALKHNCINNRSFPSIPRASLICTPANAIRPANECPRQKLNGAPQSSTLSLQNRKRNNLSFIQCPASSILLWPQGMNCGTGRGRILYGKKYDCSIAASLQIRLTSPADTTAHCRPSGGPPVLLFGVFILFIFSVRGLKHRKDLEHIDNRWRNCIGQTGADRISS